MPNRSCAAWRLVYWMQDAHLPVFCCVVRVWVAAAVGDADEWLHDEYPCTWWYCARLRCCGALSQEGPNLCPTARCRFTCCRHHQLHTVDDLPAAPSMCTVLAWLELRACQCTPSHALLHAVCCAEGGGGAQAAGQCQGECWVVWGHLWDASPWGGGGSELMQRQQWLWWGWLQHQGQRTAATPSAQRRGASSWADQACCGRCDSVKYSGIKASGQKQLHNSSGCHNGQRAETLGSSFQDRLVS